MENKFHLTATCWIPALDTPQKQYKYTIHNEFYDTETEALKVSEELRNSRVGGEFIDVVITCSDNC